MPAASIFFFPFSPASDGHGFVLNALWRSQRPTTGRWCLGLFVCLPHLVADIIGPRANFILPRMLMDYSHACLSRLRLPGYFMYTVQLKVPRLQQHFARNSRVRTLVVRIFSATLLQKLVV